jgi:hypothetical protein
VQLASMRKQVAAAREAATRATASRVAAFPSTADRAAADCVAEPALAARSSEKMCLLVQWLIV